MRRGMLMLALLLTAAWVSADPLSDLMDATGLKYKITKSGNAQAVFDLDGGRSQAVYLSQRVYRVGDLSLREIWSNAANIDTDVEADTLRDLLSGGGDENVGGWMLERNDDGTWLVYYSTRLPDLSPSDLKSVMRYVAAVADAKEMELDGGDDN